MEDGLMFTYGFIILAIYVYFMWTTKAHQERIERNQGQDLDQYVEDKKEEDLPLG
jgi:Ca2+/H+ antiporter